MDHSRGDSLSSFEHVDMEQDGSAALQELTLADSAQSPSSKTLSKGPPKAQKPSRAALPSQIPEETEQTQRELKTELSSKTREQSQRPPLPRVQPAPPQPDPFKEIETAAEKAMDNAIHAARDVSSLAREAALEAAREAKQSFSQLASGFSSWWSTFDSMESDDKDVSGIPDDDAVALAVRLQLEAGEAVLESFPCQLLQRYRALNGLTPERVIPFNGTLHITSEKVLFTERANDEPPILSLHLASVQGVQLVDGARIILAAKGAGTHVQFDRFEGAGAEAALALLEHLTSSTDP